MRIKQIDLFQLNYKLLDEKYSWSRGNYVESFLTNIVKITTDENIIGFGEVCTLGSAYLPAFAKGVPSGLEEIGKHLIGKNPLEIKLINQIIDLHLLGHNYIKSPIDVACWDILGKASNQPICTLLGGRMVDEFPLYRAIPQRSPQEMNEDVLKYQSEGYTKFQLKVGGEPDVDIQRIKKVAEVMRPGDVLIADSNTGWTAAGAIRIANSCSDLDVYIEQPCLTLNECLTVREHTNLPMVLDEIIVGIHELVEANKSRAMDVVNIKISRVGGLTKAKQMRDYCESAGIMMTLEDSWGGDIATAAIAHFVGSTRPDYYFSSTDFNSYSDVSVSTNAPRRKNGRLAVPTSHGLGIDVDEKILGLPILTIK